MAYIVKITPQGSTRAALNPPTVLVVGGIVSVDGFNINMDAPPLPDDPETHEPPALHPRVSGQVRTTPEGDKEITIVWPYVRPAWDVSVNHYFRDHDGAITMEELPDAEAI